MSGFVVICYFDDRQMTITRPAYKISESCPIVLFGGSDTVFQFSQLFSNSVAAKRFSFKTFPRL